MQYGIGGSVLIDRLGWASRKFGGCGDGRCGRLRGQGIDPAFTI